MKQRTLVAVLAALLSFSFVASSSAQSVAGTDLYSVNLETGAASRVGMVGDGESLIGLALTPDGANAFALTVDNELISFAVSNPNIIISNTPITGATGLIGIDIRPATLELFAISDGSVLYVIDPATGAATAIDGPFDPALESNNVGFDFNPTVDRIRVTTDTGQNLRLNPITGMVGVNPDTGAPTIDGRLNYAAGDANAGATPNVVAAGYTNSVAGATETTLFVIDTGLDILTTQAPPNDGVLNTVGSLGVDASSSTAFDIEPATGEAYALIRTAVGLPDTGAGASLGSSQLPMFLIATVLAAVTGIAAVGLRVREN